MDSIKTPSKSSPEFRELDDLLRCGVCHETMTIPVLTPCSHSYCSFCIRKWLNTKQICPTCSGEVYENSLRKNPIVENLIAAVQRLKGKVVGKILNVKQTDNQYQLESSPPSSRKPQVEEVDWHQSKNDKYKKHSPVMKADTLKSKILNEIRTVLSTPKSKSIVKVVNSEDEDEDADDFEPTFSSRKIQTPTSKGNCQIPVGSSQTTPKTQKSPAPARVACPVCSVSYLERFINDHLDKCLLGEGPVSTQASNNASNASNSSFINKPAAFMPSPSSSGAIQTSVKSSSNAQSTIQNVKHIKKMVYNLMTDPQLKKELRKHGLATQGDRRTWQSRLQRWVSMHNAECDATHPRSLEELKKQFEKDEKALQIPANTSLSQIFKSRPETEAFESERKDYIKKNDGSYQTLINQIRSRKNLKASDPVKIDHEEDSSKDALLEEKASTVSASTTMGKERKNIEDDKNTAKAADVEKIQVISDDDDEELMGNKVVKRLVNCVMSEDSEEESPQTVKKNFKRKGKFIEDSESDEEIKRPVNKKAAVKKTSSLVLTNGRNTVRRQLRSRSQQSVDQSKQALPQRKEPSIPENKKSQKKPSKKTAVKEKHDPVLVDDAVVDSKKSSMVEAPKEKEIEDSQYDDDETDLFVSPASSEIPCGQKLKSNLEESGTEDSRDANLSQLVALMDNQDSGSSTDFE